MIRGLAVHLLGSERDVYHDYQEQVIPIKTAGNTIYAAGIGSVGILQNVIHVPNLQKQLLFISQICNQLKLRIPRI